MPIGDLKTFFLNCSPVILCCVNGLEFMFLYVLSLQMSSIHFYNDIAIKYSKKMIYFGFKAVPSENRTN